MQQQLVKESKYINKNEAKNLGEMEGLYEKR